MESAFLSQQGIVVLSNAATYFQGGARMVDAVNMATDAFGDAIMAGPRAAECKSQVREQATRTKYGVWARSRVETRVSSTVLSLDSKVEILYRRF